MHIRSVGLAFSAFALLLAVACGGGDSKGSPLSGGSGNTWDITKADDLTHTALIVAGDLPGSGWSVTDDDFDDDDKAMASGCSDFEGFKKDARAAQVSRAKRQLEKAGSTRNDFGTQVESTVTVFKDAKTAGDLANRYKGIVNSDKFVSCFEAADQGRHRAALQGLDQAGHSQRQRSQRRDIDRPGRRRIGRLGFAGRAHREPRRRERQRRYPGQRHRNQGELQRRRDQAGRSEAGPGGQRHAQGHPPAQLRGDGHARSQQRHADAQPSRPAHRRRRAALRAASATSASSKTPAATAT